MVQGFKVATPLSRRNRDTISTIVEYRLLIQKLQLRGFLQENCKNDKF